MPSGPPVHALAAACACLKLCFLELLQPDAREAVIEDLLAAHRHALDDAQAALTGCAWRCPCSSAVWRATSSVGKRRCAGSTRWRANSTRRATCDPDGRGKALSATASSDAPYIRGIERPDTAALPHRCLPRPQVRRSPKKRLKIWQIRSGWLCSVVGTCLTSSEVERIVRRCGLASRTMSRHTTSMVSWSRERASAARSPGDHQDPG